MFRATRLLRLVIPPAAVLALAIAAPANAGVLVSSATSCDSQTFEQPFTPWADPFSYVLAPGGTFEGAAWSGGSSAAGNEPYYVHAGGESHSMSVSGSATSSAMCVGIEHPTVRFFARNSGSMLSTLRVDVLFEDAAGAVHALPIGVVAAGSSWSPTLPMAIVANLLPLLPGDHTAVAFRLTPQGYGGNWQVDDFYVDPYGHG